MKSIFLFLLVTLLWLACGQNNLSKIPEETITSEVEQDTVAVQPEKVEKKTTKPIDFDTLQWTELTRLDSSFILDLRYATEDNFVKEKMYECARCFLRPPAAKVLFNIHQEFKSKGLHIKLLDCYRPAPVQQRLWNKVPNASYVTPPSKGSMHNRGLAVDLTLVDADGKELDMGTAYDFFGRKAHHTHKDLPEEVLKNRRLLKSTMEAAGFKSIRTEWWHYSFPAGKFGIDDMEWACEE